jgi:thiamine-phosphate pyrophosphorylase
VENTRPLIDAGADFIAVCQAVWNHAEPARVALDFDQMLQS